MYHFLESSVLGKPLDNKFYQILGAGISGLLMGYFLKQKNIPFNIYEISDRTGGLIQTQTNAYGIAEQAANGFLMCSEMQKIFETIKIEVLKNEKTSSKKYIVRNKKLSIFPLKFSELLPLLRKIFISHKLTPVTVDDFGKICLGDAVTNQIIEPVMKGIYGGHINKLSFPAALPEISKAYFNNQSIAAVLLKKMFKEYFLKDQKPLLKGTLGFEKGMGELIAKLSDYLKNEIVLNYDASKLPEFNDNIICCLPAYNSSFLFKEHLISQILSNIQYIPLISTTFYFNKNAFNNFKPGFGCLIPANEKLKLFGIIFNSCNFKNRVFNDEHISITCITGGIEQKELLDLENDLLIKEMLVELDMLFGLKEDPLHYAVFKHKRGIPLYSPQLYNDWNILDKHLKNDFPNIRLFGNYTGNISIRGMCQQAAKATKNLI